MEKQSVCKICSKRFSNGKAMGGHMRSHMVKLPLPPKPLRPPSINQRASPPSSSSSFNFNLSKVINFQSPPFSHYSSPPERSDLFLQDRESDTDSHPRRPKPTRKRSKRRRDPVEEEEEPVSSASERLSTEDVALCLLMMSRDRWRNETAIEDKEDEEDSVYDSADEDEEEDEDSVIWRLQAENPRRALFKCTTCNKAFKSYQALGGHKASHKKFNDGGAEDQLESDWKSGVHHVHKVFECPFCPKVFESGQALGGHKKVHLSYLNNLKNTPHPPKFVKNSIDLNRPAYDYDYDYEQDDDEEEEEEEEEEASQLSFLQSPI